MALYQWSSTAASNSTVGSINWAEGQAPSSVNNSAREMMAQLAKYTGGVINAKDYGATGNGSDTDTTALQAAITAATATSGAVYIPPGTYVTGALTASTNNIIIYGAGNATILKAIAGTTTPILTCSGTGITVRDLSINGNKAAVTGVGVHGVKFTGARGRALNLYVYDVAGIGITSFDADSITVSHCTLVTCGVSTNTAGAGVSLYGGDGHIIANNYCRLPSRIGFRVQGSSCTATIDPTTDPKGCVISDNIVDEYHNSGVGTDWPIAISAGCTAYSIVISGNSIYSSTTSDVGNGIDVNGVYECVIANNVIQNALNGIDIDYDPDGDRVSVVGNYIKGCSGKGIVYAGEASAESSAMINNNHIVNCGAAGINVTDMSGGTISNNIVMQDEVSTNTNVAGIFMSSTYNSQVTDNLISDKRAAGGTPAAAFDIGVYVGDGCTGNRIMGNRLHTAQPVSANQAKGAVNFSTGTGAGDNEWETQAWVTTTDETPTAITQFKPTDGYAYFIQAEVYAHGTAKRASYMTRAMYYRTGANPAEDVESTVSALETDTNTDVAWDATANYVRLLVTGIAATSIPWRATVHVKGELMA